MSQNLAEIVTMQHGIENICEIFSFELLVPFLNFVKFCAKYQLAVRSIIFW
jgi:hypothetical protein